MLKVDISKLMTIKNYALKESVTPAYIYKLIKESKMDAFIIDGVQFVDITKYPVIPVINRRY